jgi:hypothetical protein
MKSKFPRYNYANSKPEVCKPCKKGILVPMFVNDPVTNRLVHFKKCQNCGFTRYIDHLNDAEIQTLYAHFVNAHDLGNEL